jgi:phosphoribosylformylglycinamidine synthase subunit PurQ / glutaminase
MKFVVLQFPGSNCDSDCHRAVGEVLQQPVRFAWHKDTRIDADETIIVPGGFSYGDYLRCGAIARFSPIMKSVKEAAERGQKIIGICNGFQILCEAGLLPGALVRNRKLHFICQHVNLRVESNETAFTTAYQKGQILNIPIAHGEGCYVAEPDVLTELKANNQILFRYVDALGQPSDAANPNGAAENIAGIRNKQGNVLGMMPHPERACEALLGSVDGLPLFQSLLN